MPESPLIFTLIGTLGGVLLGCLIIWLYDRNEGGGVVPKDGTTAEGGK